MKAGDILKSSYARQIASPEWREFAKHIRKTKGNACEICRRTGLVTQVHHWAYRPGSEPWEYTAQEVAVLCESCHREMHERLTEFRCIVFPRLTPQSFRVLTAALGIALHELKADGLAMSYAIAELVSMPGALDRFAKAWAESSKRLPPKITP